MIVPELPAEIRDLKARAARFVEEELYPVEERIAERGEIDRHEIHDLKDKARAAGFSNYNVPSGARRPRPADARPGGDRGGGRQGDERARLHRLRAGPARAARAGEPRAAGALRPAYPPTRAPGGVGDHRARGRL